MLFCTLWSVNITKQKASKGLAAFAVAFMTARSIGVFGSLFQGSFAMLVKPYVYLQDIQFLGVQ